LAETIVEMTGSKSRLVHHDLPRDDPRQRRPDIALARKAIGWEPAVPLETGLRRTVSYFEQLLPELAATPG
jgi:UDP-glucuronate decarboxylase